MPLQPVQPEPIACTRGKVISEPSFPDHPLKPDKCIACKQKPESVMPSRLHLPGTPYVWLSLAKVLFFGGHTEQECCSGISDGQLRHSARYGVSASRIQEKIID